MSSKTTNEQTEQEIMASIQVNIHRDDFRKYLGLCVRKWERLKVELEIIDAIMGSICKHWGISRQELLEEPTKMEPRSMMYYIIKREVSLSYGEIGEIFGRPKSYVHKAVDGMAFFIEEHNKRDLVHMFHNVRNDLQKPSGGGSVAS
jgi:chromosomal replication initiation ATPase DnaA